MERVQSGQRRRPRDHPSARIRPSFPLVAASTLSLISIRLELLDNERQEVAVASRGW